MESKKFNASNSSTVHTIIKKRTVSKDDPDGSTEEYPKNTLKSLIDKGRLFQWTPSQMLRSLSKCQK